MSRPSKRLLQALAVTAELTGTRWSEPAAALAAEHFSRYPEPAILAALERCRAELRGGLSIAAVLERLDDGHPGPEAAWAMVEALDEAGTIVWTEEMAEAYMLVAAMIERDRIGARMAFLESYRAKLAAARATAKSPAWGVSLGLDAGGRAGVLADAVSRRRIPLERARTMLPAELWPASWAPERALPPHDSEQWRPIKALLASIAEAKALEQGAQDAEAAAKTDAFWRDVEAARERAERHEPDCTAEACAGCRVGSARHGD